MMSSWPRWALSWVISDSEDHDVAYTSSDVSRPPRSPPKPFFISFTGRFVLSQGLPMYPSLVWIHCADHLSYHRDPPASTPGALGLQVCATTPGFLQQLFKSSVSSIPFAPLSFWLSADHPSALSCPGFSSLASLANWSKILKTNSQSDDFQHL